MAEPPEEVAQQPAVENDDSDGEEGGRMLAWVANDNMEEDDEDEEDDEVEVEDEQPLDTEASESFEPDAPSERSGHIAVVDENIMYVWGGYRVSTLTTRAFSLQTHLQHILKCSAGLFSVQEFSDAQIL